MDNFTTKKKTADYWIEYFPSDNNFLFLFLKNYQFPNFPLMPDQSLNALFEEVTPNSTF